MPTFAKILEPQYFKHFQCLESACHDNCCTGWDVVIDKETCGIYEQCEEPLLKSLFAKHIAVNPAGHDGHSDILYAQVAMDNGVCPFFAEDGLCIIQKNLGEQALSITCDTYPRTFNDIDKTLERSLSVSCPRAAELVLLNEKPMRFDDRNDIIQLRNDRIPVLDTAADSNAKPYRCFREIRSFVIALLQDRTYPLWQRLIILSVFCHRLEQIYVEDVPNLIAYFQTKIQSGVFRESMNQADSRVEEQLQVTKILIDHRLNGNPVGESFRAHMNEFKKGLGDEDGAPLETVAGRYAKAYAAYYRPLMEKHEYILENYLVNYVFKNLFPFGPQKSLYFEQKSIYTEYILMALHYSLIKTLLIGLAGYHRENFNTQHVAALIQSFAKTIEHNLPYLKQAVQFIEVCGMNNTGGMTVLIKN